MQEKSNSAKTADGRFPAEVLLIAPQPFFVSRGTPINVRAMAEILADGGYRVDLLVYPYGEDIELPGVRVIRSPRIPGVTSVPIGPSWRKIALDILLSLRALQLAVTKKYTVYHGIEEGGFVAGSLAIIRKSSFIFDMDSCMVDQLAESGFIKNKSILAAITKMESFFIGRADAVITVCSALTRKARQLKPDVYVNQIEDFPYDADRREEAGAADQLRTEFGVAGRKVILYTGNLEVYQGIELLLESFAKARATEHNALLMIVGGSGINAARTRSLMEKAAALGIKSDVIFTGPRPEQEMNSFMELASVLVSPRAAGVNTPLKLYSYMAAAKPIVATRIESHTQVLTDETAFLAEPSPEALAEALSLAISASEAAVADQQRRAVKAKQLVEEKYSRKEFARRLIELYNDVAGPGKIDSAQTGAVGRASKPVISRTPA